MMNPNKVAVVTGGSAGIGKEIVSRLLSEGFEVVSMSLGRSGLSHARLHEVEVDLMDRAAAGQAAADVARRFEPTTVVHNAGVIRAGLIADVKLEDLDALVNLHLGAAIQLVQASLPAMRERRYGRIVLMSSRATMGAQTRTSYSATKAGMIGMARTWALELAPEGITVNVLAPGPVHSDQFYGVIPKGSERESKVAASIPVGRIGEPEDIARAVSFFVQPEASFITGQVLYVCGGASLGSLSL